MNKTFEEILDEYEELTYTNKGTSMMPMLRPEKDLFTIQKKQDNQQFKVDDIILFKRNGKYILHRIISTNNGIYKTMGDNCLYPEDNIIQDEILGYLVSFQRKKRRYSVTDSRYLLYVKCLKLSRLTKPLKRKLHGLLSYLKKQLNSL